MPLSIIRNDITKMQCDAIVNATNHRLMPGGGVDAAIHSAAGAELLKTCQQLGGLHVGQAKLTPAYDLPCKLIIHTVGPWWQGGNHREREFLESCYAESLKMAKAAKCESIAFPLIASGTHGYPKDDVLQVALSVIKPFLYENDMQVYLVLFDKDEYTLDKALSDELSAYLEKEYEAYGFEEDLICGSICADEEISPHTKARRAARKTLSSRHLEKPSVPVFESEEDIFKNMYDGFALTLMKFIDEKEMDDVACYKKANVSRQTWHKILNDKNYKPNKKTIISFAIALELDIDDTQRLLASAGFILSKSNKFDLIIMYCIVKGIYDVFEIDAILFQYDQETLASKA